MGVIQQQYKGQQCLQRDSAGLNKVRGWLKPPACLAGQRTKELDTNAPIKGKETETQHQLGNGDCILNVSALSTHKLFEHNSKNKKRLLKVIHDWESYLYLRFSHQNLQKERKHEFATFKPT